MRYTNPRLLLHLLLWNVRLIPHGTAHCHTSQKSAQCMALFSETVNVEDKQLWMKLAASQ